MPEAEAILENTPDKQRTKGPVLFTKELPERKARVQESEKIPLPEGMRIEAHVEAGTEIGIQVLDNDNKVVGNAWSYLVPSESKYLGKPVIRSRIEVDEAHQSKGIGGALAKKLLGTIEETGGFVHQVGFTDMGSQRLRKSYEARGYKPFEDMEDLIYKEYPAKEVHKPRETPEEHYEEFLEKVKEETSTKEVLPPLNKSPVRDKTPEQKAAEEAEKEERRKRKAEARQKRINERERTKRRQRAVGAVRKVVGAPFELGRRVNAGIEAEQRRQAQGAVSLPDAQPTQYVGRSLYQPSEAKPLPPQPEARPNEGYTSEQKRALERRAADLGLPLDTTNYDNLARSIAEAIAQKAAIAQVETPQTTTTEITSGESMVSTPETERREATVRGETPSVPTSAGPTAEAPGVPQEAPAPKQASESTYSTVTSPVGESKITSAGPQEDAPVGVPDYDPNTFGTVPQAPVSTYIPKPKTPEPDPVIPPGRLRHTVERAHRNLETFASGIQETQGDAAAMQELDRTAGIINKVTKGETLTRDEIAQLVKAGDAS